MYENYFSFKCKPFELIPNPDFLFLSSTHKKAITYIDYGIKEKIGFILLTGEIGSGKTTIIRNLIKNLNGSVKLSRVNNTKASAEQLISMINEDFGLTTDGKNKAKLLGDLNKFLIDQYSNKLQPVLLIDEAQNLSSDLLEEIRMLSNLETDKAKLLQIILVGQPELKTTLMKPGMMQLRQRININYHIAPLSIDETAKYIRHRTTVAGNPDAIKIEEDMIDDVYQFSRGIPRLINIACDFALLTAYTEGKKEVTADIVKEVIRDLESRDYWNKSHDNTMQAVTEGQRAPDLIETAGNIALRLIQLEESLKSSVYEIQSLKEKVQKLEDLVAHLKESDSSEKISGLLERLEDKLATRILVRIAEENKIPELQERISTLDRAISSDTSFRHPCLSSSLHLLFWLNCQLYSIIWCLGFGFFYIL